MRTTRLMGTCGNCHRPWTELVVCVCGHKTVNHRLDLRREVCEIEGCKCRAYSEAPGQEDINPRGNAA